MSARWITTTVAAMVLATPSAFAQLPSHPASAVGLALPVGARPAPELAPPPQRIARASSAEVSPVSLRMPAGARLTETLPASLAEPINPPANAPPPSDDAFTSAVLRDGPLGAPAGESASRSAATTNPAGQSSWSFKGLFTDFFNRQLNDPCNERKPFQSDHRFDVLASPVTNPFLMEDPRALTEIRPQFFFQSIPNSTPFITGGTAQFFGVRGSLALTNWFSVTLNKLGGVWINPDDTSAFGGGGGLSEIWLGPKFSLPLITQEGRYLGPTVAALGAIFQIPLGASDVFQDTGNFSVVPYASLGANLFRTSYGSFNVIDTFGYSFGDGQRSDYFYNSLHVDFNVANANRFWPLIELNWFHYTRSGNSRPLTIEGADLANLGGTGVAGRDLLTLAGGARVAITPRWQVGAAVEFPIIRPKDLSDFRLTVDMIFRY
jgi:hypothetical protein